MFFNSDLARVMTTEEMTGSWEREASAAVSEREREREGYRHSILSLEQTPPGSLFSPLLLFYVFSFCFLQRKWLDARIHY
jgi:hypothetical protein